MKTFFLALVFTAFAGAQVLPNLVFFAGASADPNGGVMSASTDIGGAKLIGTGTYLGGVAHVGPKSLSPVQISTKIQFHVAQRILTFRNAPLFWTAEVGPDIATATGVTAAGLATATGTDIGYTVGSGPMASIPLGKSMYLMPHAEITKGSLADVGWRAGLLLGWGSN
jgi:hypothetical protein